MYQLNLIHSTQKPYLSRSPSTRILPKTGQKTITVSGEKLVKLEAKYNQEKVMRPSLTFAGIVSESAVMELERQNMLREAAFISFIGENNGIVTLKDFKKNSKYIEVQIFPDGPVCLDDDSTDCAHVGFVLALPEIRRRFQRKSD